ncbi:MAG: hypothetical protein M9949_04430 [Candidatus Kapabacteria bacterium]|nr:hypothetical protein [Candidatus Kapabacteria bacterium]
MKKAVLCEFGESHDDIFFAQFEFLKQSGYETFFIGNSIFSDRLKRYSNIDHEHYLEFGKGKISDFRQIRETWRIIKQNDINNIILNTIGGTPVRNFCLFPFGNRNVAGIIHNAGNLTSRSFTYNRIIKPKIKKIFALNKYIWENVKTDAKLNKSWIYPISYPDFTPNIIKPNDEFWVVVPGLVESDRRDYFHLLDSLIAKRLPENVKLVLLGKSQHSKGCGAEIRKIIDENNLQKNIIMFNDFVDWDTFRSYVTNADLLATLIHPEYANFANYSTNKISGTYLLSFGHQIPLLSHEHFMTYDDIKTSSLFYNQRNLAETIDFLYQNRQYIEKVKLHMKSNPNFDFGFNQKKYISLIES